jgi:hypothetical protein
MGKHADRLLAAAAKVKLATAEVREIIEDQAIEAAIKRHLGDAVGAGKALLAEVGPIIAQAAIAAAVAHMREELAP